MGLIQAVLWRHQNFKKNKMCRGCLLRSKLYSTIGNTPMRMFNVYECGLVAVVNIGFILG